MSNLGSLQPRMFFQGFRVGDFPTRNYPRGPENLGLATGITLIPIGDLEDEDLYQHLSLFLTGSQSAYLSFADMSPDFLRVWQPVALFMGSFSTIKATRFALSGDINERGNLILGGDEFRMLHVALKRSRGATHRETRKLHEDILYTVQFDLRTSVQPVIIPLPAYTSLTSNNDVALVFPYELSSSPAVLWAKREDLENLSSYFKAIFAGGYSEENNILVDTSKMMEACDKDIHKIITTERNRWRPAGSVPIPSETDTDDEGTDGPARRARMAFNERQATSFARKSADIRYLVIRDTRRIAYEALLSWALTGSAQFASLARDDLGDRDKFASPKAVYVLAHQLDIPALQAYAAENFEKQLTPFNVLEQLFSTDCFTYPVLRQAGLRVLEQQWARVKECGGLDKLFKLVEAGRGDTQEMMKVAIDILRRV